MRLYPDGWLCGTDSYGVEQAFGLSTDGQVEFYYNKKQVWAPQQRRAGSYVALNNDGMLQVYDDNDNVVLSRGCGQSDNGMTPNRVALSNAGGFALAYQNGGIFKNIWSVNDEGKESGCDNSD